MHKIIGYCNIFFKNLFKYIVEKKVYPYFFYKNNSFSITKEIKNSKNSLKKTSKLYKKFNSLLKISITI